jgi:Zn-dependent alcohol dehydrogenase
MEITAAVLRDRSRPFSIEQVELEEPRAGEILVRVVAVGVCHTDLSVGKGGERARRAAGWLADSPRQQN